MSRQAVRGYEQTSAPGLPWSVQVGRGSAATSAKQDSFGPSNRAGWGKPKQVVRARAAPDDKENLTNVGAAAHTKVLGGKPLRDGSDWQLPWRRANKQTNPLGPTRPDQDVEMHAIGVGSTALTATRGPQRRDALGRGHGLALASTETDAARESAVWCDDEAGNVIFVCTLRRYMGAEVTRGFLFNRGVCSRGWACLCDA